MNTRIISQSLRHGVRRATSLCTKEAKIGANPVEWGRADWRITALSKAPSERELSPQVTEGECATIKFTQTQSNAGSFRQKSEIFDTSLSEGGKNSKPITSKNKVPDTFMCHPRAQRRIWGTRLRRSIPPSRHSRATSLYTKEAIIGANIADNHLIPNYSVPNRREQAPRSTKILRNLATHQLAFSSGRRGTAGAVDEVCAFIQTKSPTRRRVKRGISVCASHGARSIR